MARPTKVATLVFLSLTASHLAAAPAMADQSYLETRIGVNVLDDVEETIELIDLDPSLNPLIATGNFQPGIAVEIAAGHRYNKNFRIETSVNYRRNKFDKIKIIDDGGLGVFQGGTSLNGQSEKFDNSWVQSWSGWLKGFYDIEVTQKLGAYAGGGLGVSVVKEHLEAYGYNDEDSDNVRFSWQAIAGATWALDPQLDLIAEYQFTTIQDIQIDHGLSSIPPYDLNSHTIFFGVRNSF